MTAALYSTRSIPYSAVAHNLQDHRGHSHHDMCVGVSVVAIGNLAGHRTERVLCVDYLMYWIFGCGRILLGSGWFWCDGCMLSKVCMYVLQYEYKQRSKHRAMADP